MGKYEAATKMEKFYRDPTFAVTIKPAKMSDPSVGRYDSENPLLFTGEYTVLLYLNSVAVPSFVDKNIDCIWERQTWKITPLFARQPDPFRNTPQFNPLSWDEHNGILYTLAFTELNWGSSYSLAKKLVEYGDNYNWAFIEEKPFTNPFSDLKKYGSRIRQPRDRAFFRIVAGDKPKWYELLHLAIASVITAYTDYEETSGKKMAWFRFKTIEHMKFKSKLLKLAKFLFDRRLKKLYNKECYMEEVYRIYYKDPNHPFHELIRGLK